MDARKYKDDYRLKETIVDGRIERSAEYIGNYYLFRVPEKRRKATARTLLVLNTVAVAAYLLPICTVNRLSGVPYVILPHICLALALWLEISALLQTGFGREPMTREQADRATRNYSFGYGIGLTLSAVASIGFGIWMLFFSKGAIGAWDWTFGLCDMVSLIVFMTNFVKRDSTQTYVDNNLT